MAFDIPFNILALYISISLTVGIIGIILGLKKISGAPFITVFSGIMIFALLVLVKNVQTDYVESIDYTLVYQMNVTSGSTGVAIGDTNHAIAERPANINSLLYNKPISCILIDMAKVGNPTGTATIGILSEDKQIIKSFGTIDASSLLTTQSRYAFCLPNHDYWIVSLYDRVGIIYTSGNPSNNINVFTNSANPFDSTNSVRTTLSNAGVWTDTSTSDVNMKILFDDSNISGEPVLYAFNSNESWAFMIILAVFFIFMGIALQAREWK